MTTGELRGELILGVDKILKAVLPQTHILEAAVRLLVRLDPVGGTEGHDHHKEAGISHDGTEHDSVCKQVNNISTHTSTRTYTKQTTQYNKHGLRHSLVARGYSPFSTPLSVVSCDCCLPKLRILDGSVLKCDRELKMLENFCV